MAEIGYFFTSAAGDRKYTAADFADLFNQLAQRQSGVIRGLDNTLALSNNGTLSIDMATGVAAKSGYLYQNTAAMNMALDAVTSGSKRIDRVVIRVDLTARQVVATVLKGVESGTPSAPAITGSTDVLLGQILLDRSSGSYVYTVTDERTYSDALLAPATIKKFNEGTYTIDDLAEGTTYKRVTADAVGTGNKIDLSKSGFLGKTLDNIADTATYVKINKTPGDAINAGTYKAADATTADDADKLGGTAAAAFWYSSSGTGGSDGNGGRPPAPKNQTTTAFTASSTTTIASFTDGGLFIVATAVTGGYRDVHVVACSRDNGPTVISANKSSSGVYTFLKSSNSFQLNCSLAGTALVEYRGF